ncbi:hypothetical protein JCM5296_004832 [Sporobolomyces johnsonii]
MAPSSFAPFSSPLGPLHLAPPSSIPSHTPSPSLFLSLLPSFKSKSKSKSKTLTARAHSTPRNKVEALKSLECEIDASQSTYSPLEAPRSPPPPYREAAAEGAEEDLYCEDVAADEEPTGMNRKQETKEERKRREVIEADKRIGEALKQWGL